MSAPPAATLDYGDYGFVPWCGKVDDVLNCGGCTDEDFLHNRIYDCAGEFINGGACSASACAFGPCSQLSGRRACAHASCRRARARRHAASCTARR
jgi:hypothetical protein